MNKGYQKELVSSLFFVILFFSDNAYAYINPSIFSMIALAMAGFLSVIGFYFYRIMNAVKSILNKIKLLISKS